MALLAGVTAVAQEVISLPLDENGNPRLPPDAVTETAYVIETFAGTGDAGFDGDGGSATEARLWRPRGIAVDAVGSVYVADTGNGRVRRIDPSGIITTVAGTGESGSDGDGGPAIEAQLSLPTDVALDAEGNLYIVEATGYRVRKVDNAGQISTVAGTGEQGSQGDGGPAIEAQLNTPIWITVDEHGNLYIAEVGGRGVRKVDPAGTITKIAGTGSLGNDGDGGPATAAQFGVISGLTADAQGNIFVSDITAARIRRITPDGTISTIAGTRFAVNSGHGGPALEASLGTPGGVATDADGNLFVTDFNVGGLRKIDSKGIITTIAGTDQQLFTGDKGLAIDAELAQPVQVGTDASGNLYLVEYSGNKVRILRPTATTSRFTLPLGTSGESRVLTVTSDGSLRWEGSPVVNGMEFQVPNGSRYAISQTEDATVLATFVPKEQTVELQAGTDITLTTREDGTWWIGDQVVENGHRHTEADREYLLEWTGSQWRLAKYTLRTIAGTVDVAEGVAATEARLFAPYSVAVDTAGNTYVSESSNHRVRKIDAAGVITTIAGTGERGYAGDGGPAAEAELNSPTGIAVNELGEILVADSGNHVVRKIDLLGDIVTIETADQVLGPIGLALDASGNVLITESNHRVRRIDSQGNVTTIAGVASQSGGYNDSDVAVSTRLSSPSSVALDASGNIYVADSLNHRIRKIDTTGTIMTIAGTGDPGFSGDGGVAVEAQIHTPSGVLVDDVAGNVYISDTWNSRIRRIDSSGIITTLAAGELPDSFDAAAPNRLILPLGLAFAADGNLLIADSASSSVHRLTASGRIMRMAGSGEAFDRRDGGPAASAQFRSPLDVATDAVGNVYVLDRRRVRRIDSDGRIDSITATDEIDDYSTVHVDALGNIYIADNSRNSVRKIDVAGTVTTIAGTGEAGFSGDGGPATAAQLNGPRSIVSDSVGNIYIADLRNHRVRRIDPSGIITTYVGTGVPDESAEMGYVVSTGDLPSDYQWEEGGVAPAATARLHYPQRLAVDADDFLYVFDFGNFSASNQGRVGKIDTSSAEPLITPLSPMEIPNAVTGFEVDESGNVYASQGGYVFMIGPDGLATIIAGGGTTRFTGNGEPAAGVSIGPSTQITLDPEGNIWLADSLHRRVHVLEPVP